MFQSTIEVLDGHSEEWGFSIPDMACNMAGLGLFALQQHVWDEQRILIKFSAFPKNYSQNSITSTQGVSTSYDQRAAQLFGSSLPSQVLKDYNAQTIWLSVNPSSFSSRSTVLPKWLNVAVGMGAENMFGGFQNSWTNENGTYNVSLPRYKQYYLSLDIDLSRIPVKSPFWKSVLSVVNIIKIPFPTLEYNSQQGLVGHWIHF